MKTIKCVLALAGLLSLATAASATTYYQCSTGATATNTWCFVPGSDGTISDGTSYSLSSGGVNHNTVSGTVSVYSEQVKNSNNSFYSFSDSTINGMFAVNDNSNVEGEGIAPYNPQEGGSPFPSQDGITDTAGGNSSYSNIILIELGSNIAQGTTLNFLLQAGIGAGSDVVSDYYQDGGSVNVGMNQGISPSGMTLNGTTTAGEISTLGTTDQSQLKLTKNTSGVEWVAIEADCHYLLLSSITGTAPTGVPEPRFYGLLLASLLGLAGVVYQRRRAAQTIA